MILSILFIFAQFLSACEIGTVSDFVLKKEVKNPKAVVLTVAGLNFLPQRFQDIEDALNQSGLDVLSARLPGHRGVKNEIRYVKYHDYETYMREFICLGQSIAKLKNIPLYYLGFSFGAILGFNSDRWGYQFEKMVTISPPIKTPWWISLLFYLRGPYILPRFFRSLDSYSANPGGVGFDTYNALGKFTEQANTSIAQGKYRKTKLLFIYDKKDFVLNIDETWKRIRNNFKTIVDLELVGEAKSKHHLIIDKNNLSPEEWDKLIKTINIFFTI